MLANRSHITDYIPQRAPMIMVHDIVEASDTYAVTRLQIEQDNIFVDGGKFTEPGLVENIAQTAAAQVGYQCAIKNIPVPIGYIAAVKDLRIMKLPDVHAQIITSIRIVNQVLDVTLAQGEVRWNGEVCCKCEMRIFVKQ
jgi:3-hydroxyacyl-[acyl-carrier-protein] dehydratase